MECFAIFVLRPTNINGELVYFKNHKIYHISILLGYYYRGRLKVNFPQLLNATSQKINLFDNISCKDQFVITIDFFLESFSTFQFGYSILGEKISQ